MLRWLEIYQQTEWPDLKVYFTSVTDHYATLTLSGPNSRKLLSEVTDIDLDRDAFPFMTWKEGLMWRAINDDGTLTYSFVESLQASHPGFVVRPWRCPFRQRHAVHGLQRVPYRSCLEPGRS